MGRGRDRCIADIVCRGAVSVAVRFFEFVLALNCALQSASRRTGHFWPRLLNAIWLIRVSARRDWLCACRLFVGYDRDTPTLSDNQQESFQREQHCGSTTLRIIPACRESSTQKRKVAGSIPALATRSHPPRSAGIRFRRRPHVVAGRSAESSLRSGTRVCSGPPPR